MDKVYVKFFHSKSLAHLNLDVGNFQRNGNYAIVDAEMYPEDDGTYIAVVYYQFGG